MHTFKQNIPLILGGVLIICLAAVAAVYFKPEQPQQPQQNLSSSASDFTIKCDNSTSTTMNLAANVPTPIATTSPTRTLIAFSSSTTDNPQAIWIQKGPQGGAGVAAGKGFALYGTSSEKVGAEEHYTGIYWAVSKVAARLVVDECYQ